METIHDAYLQIKDEMLSTKAISSKLTYINPTFNALIGSVKIHFASSKLLVL